MIIKWQGTDTKKVLKWNVEAESYYELLQKLIEKGLIDSYTDLEGFTFQELLDYSEELRTLKNNDNIELLYNYDFENLLKSLTDNQIRSIIEANNGMAYYQTFTKE